MGIFKNLFKQHAPEQCPNNEQIAAIPEGKKHSHKIAGAKHYEANIAKLAKKNPAYNFTQKEIIAKKLFCKNIYEYTFAPKRTELIPDPTNPHDPNAIKVIIDEQHIGYIKAGSCARILKLMQEERIAKIESTISGGKFQNLWTDGKEIQQHEKGKTEYKIEITIFEK